MRISHPKRTFWEASGIYRGLNVIGVVDSPVSNIPLPVGSCCTGRRKNFVEEANIGDGPKISNWMRLYRTCVLPPLVVTAISAIGLVGFFG